MGKFHDSGPMPQLLGLDDFVRDAYTQATHSGLRTVTVVASKTRVVRLSKVSYAGMPPGKQNRSVSLVLSVGQPNAADKKKIARFVRQRGAFPFSIRRYYKTK